jgi:hypothetical protein
MSNPARIDARMFNSGTMKFSKPKKTPRLPHALIASPPIGANKRQDLSKLRRTQLEIAQDRLSVKILLGFTAD